MKSMNTETQARPAVGGDLTMGPNVLAMNRRSRRNVVDAVDSRALRELTSPPQQEHEAAMGDAGPASLVEGNLCAGGVKKQLTTEIKSLFVRLDIGTEEEVLPEADWLTKVKDGAKKLAQLNEDELTRLRNLLQMVAFILNVEREFHLLPVSFHTGGGARKRTVALTELLDDGAHRALKRQYMVAFILKVEVERLLALEAQERYHAGEPQIDRNWKLFFNLEASKERKQALTKLSDDDLKRQCFQASVDSKKANGVHLPPFADMVDECFGKGFPHEGVGLEKVYAKK